MILHSVLIVVLSFPRIVNADKTLEFTDKMQHVVVPQGETWTINYISVSFEELRPDLHVAVWLQDAPYAPFRDPQTGEMIGCPLCLSLLRAPLDKYLFVLKGPFVVTGGNRISFAVSPPHGRLDRPLRMFVRMQVVREKGDSQ